MLLHEENVAMTVETKNNPSQITTIQSTSEPLDWPTESDTYLETNEEPVFPTVSAEPVPWPRVFPGL